MKTYPSISHKVMSSLDVIAFDKLDGSNIRAEWSPKRGFYKFGSRRCMIDENSEHLGNAVTIIKETKIDSLTAVFNNRKLKLFKSKPRSVVCFFEYCGPNSFAGQHDPNDKLDTVLIDVNVHKKGILAPSDFIDMFEHVGIPKVLYKGKAGPEFIESVRSMTLPGITGEGVVCKAPRRAGHTPFMFKIKTRAWLERLKTYCGDDSKLYDRLV